MKYFSIEELSKSASAERLAIDNTPPRAARKMLTILVEQLLDPIRHRYGAPIIVTSGYRCPALNTAVGGVANSHHIVGCAADIVGRKTHPNPPCEGGDSDIAELTSLPHREGRGGSPNLALFHLIIQMQRESAIRFTQLIAEEGYRWLHISYVPGMLRNQIIDVNACASEHNASSHAIAQCQRERSVGCDEENRSSPEELRFVALQPGVCGEVTNDNADDNLNLTSRGVNAEEPKLTSALTSTLKEYQDSG